MNLSAQDVQPARLRAVRRKVEEVHPSIADRWTAPAESTLRALRERVELAQHSEEQLLQLAWSLTPREIRWLVTGLEHWEDLRSAVCTLLRERSRQSLIHALWHTWQRRPLLAELSELLAEFGDRYGWKAISGAAYTEQVRKWVLADDPGREIQRWLDLQGLSYSDVPQLAEFPLRPDTPLLRLVRDSVLTFGSTAQLRIEGNERIRAWLPELSPDNRFRFGRNYLVRMPHSEWETSILVNIERSYGLPRSPRVTGFWEPIPEEVRRIFQSFFIKRKLRKALEDNDRYEYWVQWSDEMVDVKLGEAGSTPYGVFDFETFGVVEFFEYGKAAYFYPPEKLERLTRGTAKDPAELRQLMVLHGDKNRLIHRGNWYSRADIMMRRWIRGTRTKRRS